jgi:hypothetical protein
LIIIATSQVSRDKSNHVIFTKFDWLIFRRLLKNCTKKLIKNSRRKERSKNHYKKEKKKELVNVHQRKPTKNNESYKPSMPEVLKIEKKHLQKKENS